jgi:hypothetical protein
MYKLCNRCRFNVPAKQSKCHVCGSGEFVLHQVEAKKCLSDDYNTAVGNATLLNATLVNATLENAGVKNFQTTMKTAQYNLENFFRDSLEHLSKAAIKADAKAKKVINTVKKSISTLLSDDNSTFPIDRNAVALIAGRGGICVPVIQHTESASLLLRRGRRARFSLMSDEKLFSPSHSSTSLFDSPNTYAELNAELDIVNDPHQIAVLNEESESPPDLETLRRNVDDLKNWFENFGKDAPLFRPSVTELVKPNGQEPNNTNSNLGESSREAA